VSPSDCFTAVVSVANLIDDICSKGLDAHQTAFAVKKYKSHRQVGLPSDIVALMQA